MVTGIQPAEQGRTDAAEMQYAGRAGGKTGPYHLRVVVVLRKRRDRTAITGPL